MLNFCICESTVVSPLIKVGIAKHLALFSFILFILFHVFSAEVWWLIQLQKFCQHDFLDILITPWAWICFSFIIYQLLKFQQMSCLIQSLSPIFKCFITISYQSSRGLLFFLKCYRKSTWYIYHKVPLQSVAGNKIPKRKSREKEQSWFRK